jgi:hypothetical protein
MPDSRAERITFAVGLCAIVALAIAVVFAFGRYNSSTPRATAQVRGSASDVEQTAYQLPARLTPAKPTKPAKTAKPAQTAQREKPAAATKSRPVVVKTKVSLAATRGDCWLEVHANTADGKTLYVGTLVKGKSLDVSAKALWIRFGAPQNVDLKVNGDGAPIPSDSLDVVVSRNGVRAAA